MTDKFKDMNGVLLQGHIKITDPGTGEVLIDKRNAIHYENMSIALAESLASAGQGPIYKMAFGNGGTSVDPTGIITYLTPNSTGSNASLYNQTFEKIVAVDPNNTDPVRNKIETRHVSGTNYTDILGLVSSAAGTGIGKLLTHVIFHPVQKSLNRLIQIDYTVRVQSLTGFNEA
jgi:hypothetical protein